jgi:hypothetical protein
MAVAFACGISIGLYAWRPPLWWLVAAVGFTSAGAYFLRRRSWASYVLGLGAIGVIGALVIQAGAAPNSTSQGFSALSDGREVIITAHVTAEGIQRSETSGGTAQRIDVETEQIASNDQSLPAQIGIRVSIFSKK